MVMLVVVLLLLVPSHCWGFIWPVDDELKPLQTLTFSERHMFGSHRGPGLLPNERSTITAVLQYDIYLKENRTTGFQYAVYLPDDDNRYTGIGLCNDDPFLYEWARNVQNQFSFTSYRGARRLTDGTMEYHYVGNIHHIYQVYEEGWHNIDIQTCAGDSIYLSSRLNGDVSFKNPYGYVPGEQWGILPFETIRATLTTLLAIGYSFLCWVYKDSLLPLHRAVSGTLFICAFSAILWCSAFITLNQTGKPFCCPFPPIVSASQLVQILRQTLARVLLLVVSLGYGIVRPKLQRCEWIMVALITAFYFVAALAYEITDIIFFDVHPDTTTQTTSWVYPALVADFLFLGWIYLAMSSTIRVLNEFQQTHKLEMYDNLWITIGIFVVQFLLVSVIMSLNDMGFITWPWQWNWVQQMAWELVNMSIIVAVAVICRPTDHSNLLSYASQLPMDDPDFDVDTEDGIEVTCRRDKQSDRFSLPLAEDDDEFGLQDSD